MTFLYKEADFKETSIGKIPKDWEIVNVGDILSLEYGKGLPERERISGEYPVVGSNGIVGYHNKALIKGPGIVIGRKGTIGAVSWVERDFWPIDTTYFVKLKKDGVDLKWLYYVLIKLDLPKLHLSDVVPGLKREIAYSLKIPFPSSLKEQRAVAGILGVVDSVIAKTDEVIVKTERLKKGLMQTLLTRGIGHKEFKETEIGKIPKTWQVVRIKDVAEIRGNKRINDFEKIAFIPMELIPDSQIFAKYEIRTKEDVKSFTYCEAGDILLAKITPSLENGKQGVVPFDVPDGFALATTEVFPIRCKNIDRFFLFYVLKFSKFRDKIISSMIGTTGRQRATRDSVEKLEIPLPPLEEQQKIGGILSEVDKKLELERNEKAKLERIKRGLMDLLLTGKVRVKVEVNCDAVCSG